MTGWCDGEVLPPYDSARHQQNAQRIISYLQGRKTIYIDNTYYPFYIHELAELPAVVEVVGGLVGFCVLNAVESALRNERAALVNPSLVFALNHNFSPYLLGKMMLQDVLSGKPERSCLIYDGQLIFYRRANLDG